MKYKVHKQISSETHWALCNAYAYQCAVTKKNQRVTCGNCLRIIEARKK